jgi:hypothetical protein
MQVRPKENDAATGLRAAQYLRVSTEQQKYSIENQAAAIAAYAARRNIGIVRTYSDRRSGVRIVGRDGLKQLIQDVQRGHTNFNCILVYDVSRWGRFQDVDESGYYEFICRRAGINIHYCADEFENDGSLTVGMAVARSVANGTGPGPSRRWEIRKLKYRRADLTLVIRMDSSNRKIKNYYLLPTVSLPQYPARVRISDRNFGEFGYDDLNGVLKAITDSLSLPLSARASLSANLEPDLDA